MNSVFAPPPRVQFDSVNKQFVMYQNRWDPKKNITRVERVVFKGITHKLSVTFWPNYVYEEAVKRPKRSPVFARRGMQRGIRLDQELQMCTNWMREHPQLKMIDFLCPELVQPSRLSEKQIEPFKLMCKSLDASTLRIVNFLNEHGLVFYQSQLPVASMFLQVATGVDLVCQHEGNRGENKPVVLIEIKSGGLGYYEKSNGLLKWPYQNQQNCPRNQHQLQLTLTRWLYEEDYLRLHRRPASISKAFVLRTDAYETRMYEQEEWTGFRTQEYKSLVYEALLTRG
jgi:hypothetical protein